MNTFTSAAGYHVYALAASEADSHWVLLLSAMLLSAVACSLIMAAAHTVLPLMAPETYRAMVAEKACQRVAVPKNVTEWWPAIVTPLLVYRETRELTLAALAAPEQALYLPAGPAMWSATGAALGYMVYDCGVMAVFRGALRESMGGEMYNLLWFHHVFSLVFWPYALHSSAACVFVAWFLLSEVTNVFLNCRTLLIKMRKTSGAPFMIVRASPAQLTAAAPTHAPASVPASTPGTVPPPLASLPAPPAPSPRSRGACGAAQASTLFLVSFLVVRILPIPFFVAVWSRADWGHTTHGTLLVTAITTPLPVLLNLYWFGLALKGAARLLRPAKKKDKAKQ